MGLVWSCLLRGHSSGVKWDIEELEELLTFIGDKCLRDISHEIGFLPGPLVQAASWTPPLHFTSFGHP